MHIPSPVSCSEVGILHDERDDHSRAARRLLLALLISLAGEIKSYNERLILWLHAPGGVHHNSRVNDKSFAVQI